MSEWDLSTISDDDSRSSKDIKLDEDVLLKTSRLKTLREIMEIRQSNRAASQSGRYKMQNDFESTKRSTPTILSSGQKNISDSEAQNTKRETQPESYSTTTRIKGNSMSRDGEELRQTQSETESRENHIFETEKSDSLDSSSDESRSVELVHSGESKKLVANLNEETLQSLSMLQKSNSYLFKLMKNLVHPDLDPTIRTVDVDKARTAAELGKQIISGVRMQLDICKFVKELRDEK